MRRLVALAALGLSLALCAGAAAQWQRAFDGATVIVSSDQAGARPVALTVSIQAELRCGRLNARSVSVTLPATARVPATVARTAVHVGGAVPATVTVRGRTLTAFLLVPRISCYSIAEGTVRLVFGLSAGIGNPARPGTYAIGVAAGAERWTATLRIV